MISTREEAELMFRKWMAESVTIFFTTVRSDHTEMKSFYGKITAVSENVVMIMGDEFTAEIDFDGCEFGYVTERDAPAEIRDAASDFESGLVIRQADNSIYGFFEVREH